MSKGGGLRDRAVDSNGSRIGRSGEGTRAATGPITEGEPTIGCCLDLTGRSTVFPAAGRRDRAAGSGVHGQEGPE